MYIQNLPGAIFIILLVIFMLWLVCREFYNKYIKPYSIELKSKNTIGGIIGGVVVVSILIYLAYFYKGSEYGLVIGARNSLADIKFY